MIRLWLGRAALNYRQNRTMLEWRDGMNAGRRGGMREEIAVVRVHVHKIDNVQIYEVVKQTPNFQSG